MGCSPLYKIFSGRNMKSGLKKKFLSLSLANPWLELMRPFLVINKLYRDIKNIAIN
jgi:hypothetical protein